MPISRCHITECWAMFRCSRLLQLQLDAKMLECKSGRSAHVPSVALLPRGFRGTTRNLRGFQLHRRFAYARPATDRGNHRCRHALDRYGSFNLSTRKRCTKLQNSDYPTNLFDQVYTRYQKYRVWILNAFNVEQCATGLSHCVKPLWFNQCALGSVP